MHDPARAIGIQKYIKANSPQKPGGPHDPTGPHCLAYGYQIDLSPSLVIVTMTPTPEHALKMT